MFLPVKDPEPGLRYLNPEWDYALIVASLGISFLGSFTSSQLMCHARLSPHFSSVLLWSLLASMIFGFCSVWSLHEVAMLACKFDLEIGIDAPLTVLSSFLAVMFTFAALSGDLLWARYRMRPGRRRRKRLSRNQIARNRSMFRRGDSENRGLDPLLHTRESNDEGLEAYGDTAGGVPMSNPPHSTSPLTRPAYQELSHSPSSSNRHSTASSSDLPWARDHVNGIETPAEQYVTESSGSQTSSFRMRNSSASSSLGIGSALGILTGRATGPAGNAFVATASLLYTGTSCRTLGKGFLWSLAITSMHYVGIFGLQIPNGYLQFNIWLVILSGLISWTVCTVGVILMPAMETHLLQQILFSTIATAGVAAMHFTGMYATRFYSTAAPSELRGYPPALANAVVAIAFVTCIAANMLLAHSATVSRIKLAEIVATRKELWRTIALKENAEASARARSDFIASASHEIRTPLHHLQGYSDLLAHTELTEEGRSLLTSIQRATKTLSLITNNVLDWSKFERHSENSYRPTALDLRAVCESIIVLLPNIDDESHVELFVVVSKTVPKSVFLDEMYIHRILMNLLSNAMKFTRSGYILLSIEMKDDNLITVVKDTGCGLDPSFIPEMWTPFRQGEVRGSARGTGLGLSIIKQLLHKMNGTVDVESQYMDLADVGPDRSGTTFTVTIPLQSTMDRSENYQTEDLRQVAILSNEQSRSLDGFKRAWATYGFEVEVLPDAEVIAGSKGRWQYVWADLDYLQAHPSQLTELLRHRNFPILVPYDTHDSLEGIPGILSAPNVIMVSKPLIWHTFERRIAAAKYRRSPAAPSQALRFAAEVEVMNDEASEPFQPVQIRGKSKQILVVEDNNINQKLATKMLVKLGYQVLAAHDGEDAIALLVENGTAVDLILMDQSMPKKDGVSATKEIREMEAEGKLRGRIPIIAVTAVVNPQAQGAFHDAGADDFLAKPLSLNRLRDTLAMYLS